MKHFKINFSIILGYSHGFIAVAVYYHIKRCIMQVKSSDISLYSYLIAQLLLVLAFGIVAIYNLKNDTVRRRALSASMFFLFTAIINYIFPSSHINYLNIAFVFAYLAYYCITYKYYYITDDPVWKFIKNVDKHFKKGKLGDAIIKFNNILLHTPASMSTIFSLGYAYSLSDQLDLAVSCYKKYLEYKKDSAAAHVYLGLAYGRQNSVKLAIEEYKKAININEEFSAAHCGLAISYLQVNEPELALREAIRAIELDRDNIFAYVYTGDSYLELGDNGKAIKYFKEAISRDRKCARAYYDLARAYSMENNIVESMRNLKVAFDLDNELKEMVKEDSWFDNIAAMEEFIATTK